MKERKLRTAKAAPRAYIFRVPDQVGELLLDFGHQVKAEDDKDYQGADEPPRDLPVDIGLMSNHELQVLVESEAEGC